MSDPPTTKTTKPDSGVAAYRMGLMHAAQMAEDQASNDPLEPGTWNDACAYIAKLIREGAGT